MQIKRFETFLNEDDTSYDNDTGEIKITGSVTVAGKNTELKDAVFKTRANTHNIMKLIPVDSKDLPALVGLKGEKLKEILGKKLEDPAAFKMEGVGADGKPIAGEITLTVFSVSKTAAKPEDQAIPPVPGQETVETDNGKKQILAAVQTAIKAGAEMDKVPNKDGTINVIIKNVKL